VVFKLYIKAGFNIKYVCADQEFDGVLSKMKDKFKFTPNIAAAQEHVPVVERSIRVVKEWCRAVFHTNLFKSLPRVLMKAVMQESMKKLNFFPVKGSCYEVYSPRTILHEVNLRFDQCKVPQLSYVMAHDEPTPTNSTQARAIDGIYMRALTTAQGGHEIFNVKTGEVIQRRNITSVPVTDAIVKAVKAWARRDSMEAYKIENKHGIILYDSMIAGVELEDQEETKDPPEEEAQEGAQEFEENQQFDAQPTQEIDQMQGENKSTESTMLTAVIEAKERDVATCDIPNAFIQTEVEELDKQGNRIIMKIRGVLVELLVWIVPEFEEFVIEEGSGKVLYLCVKKAI
jgi:hypothetical protein